MKIRQQFLLLLALLLLITGCDSGTTTSVADRVTPTAEQAATHDVNATIDTEPTEEAQQVSKPSEPTEVPESPDQTADQTTSPTPETGPASPTAQATPTLEATVPPEPTYPPAVTATPEVQAFVTPKARSQWRAGSGELFIRFDNGIKNFQYYLYVPEEWWGIFEMRQDTEDTFLFNYIGNPNMKKEVFRVNAYPEHVWKEKQANGDPGVEFFSLRGVMFVYYIAQDNPFEGEEAEVFQSMIEDVPEIINEELEIVSRRFNQE